MTGELKPYLDWMKIGFCFRKLMLIENVQTSVDGRLFQTILFNMIMVLQRVLDIMFSATITHW